MKQGAAAVRLERSIVRGDVWILRWIRRIVGRVGKRAQPISRVLVELVQAKAAQQIARWRVRADVSSHRVMQHIVERAEKPVRAESVVCKGRVKDAHAILPIAVETIVWICKAMGCIAVGAVVRAYRAKCAKKAVVRACRG